jgi:hypothetical protein
MMGINQRKAGADDHRLLPCSSISLRYDAGAEMRAFSSEHLHLGGVRKKRGSIGFGNMAKAATTKATLPTANFGSFEEFWPYYLREHAKPETRALHILGTTVGILGVGAWLMTGRFKYLAAGLAGSYGSAWIGHFAYEGNRPATFGHPVWSLEADLRMYRLWLDGGLEAEIQRVLK